MSAPYSTLLLDTATWDLTVDASGNIAVAAPPYAIAQDVATAIRVFLGECYYDTTLGIPYFTQFLGQPPNFGALKAAIQAVALGVPAVVSATCFITGFSARAITGQVQVTDKAGVTTAVEF